MKTYSNAVSVHKVLEEAVPANVDVFSDQLVERTVHDAFAQHLLPIPPLHSLVTHLLSPAP